MLGEFFLGGDLVEGKAAFGHAFAGVGDATVFQDLLHLAVFAEGAVQGDEGQLGLVRQDQVGVLDVDFGDFRA